MRLNEGGSMHKSAALTAALEDYLEAIFNLSRGGNAARSRDIAEALGVHKSTVTAALKSLKSQHLVNYSPYEAVTLTREGEEAAEDVARRHAVLKGFFVGVLKVDEQMAETAACGMEHALPREIVDKLTAFAVLVHGSHAHESSAQSGKGKGGKGKVCPVCGAKR